MGRQEPYDTLQIYLASALDGFCVMAVDADQDTGLVAPANMWFSLATVEGDSFAYVTHRRTADSANVEFVVHALGQHRQELAASVAEQVRIWDREHRGGPGPQFSVHPAGTADGLLPEGRVIDKIHSRVVISWPVPASAA